MTEPKKYSYYLLSSGEHEATARPIPDTADMAAHAGNWPKVAELVAAEAAYDSDVSHSLSWPITVVLLGKDEDRPEPRRLGTFSVSLDTSPRYKAKAF